MITFSQNLMKEMHISIIMYICHHLKLFVLVSLK